MNKSALIVVGVGLAAVGCGWWYLPSKSQSSTWPRKPVRLVVPGGSGGGVDLTARLIAEELGKYWNQAVIVDNRPGGDGLMATASFVQGKDDHALFFGPSAGVTLLPQTHRQLPYDPERDLVPISIASVPNIAIAATASFPVTSLAELVRVVRARPGEYRWTAVPSVPEMLFASFLKLEKLEMKRIAYSEIATGLQDFAQGRVQIMVGAMPTVEAQVRAGRARLLAVATTTRALAAPEVPTMAEAGYPALTVDGSFGFYGWRNMPDDLRDRIAADVRRAIADPSLAARLRAMGQTPRACTPEEFSALHVRQRQQFGSLVNLLGLKPE